MSVSNAYEPVPHPNPPPDPLAAATAYRGQRAADGRAIVVALDRHGHTIRVLNPGPARSYSWGRLDEGAELLARDLLLDALRRHARCAACYGTSWVLEDDYGATRAYRPETDAGVDPDLIRPCRWCRDGVRIMPTQRFSWAYIGRWSPAWQITRAEIQAWYQAVVTSTRAL